MRNFMEAYNAVHSVEAKEEYYSQRDPVSEMNIVSLTDDDLREISEEVCETLFAREIEVQEAADILSEVLAESENTGRNAKLSRLFDAFAETFTRIQLKANQLEEFAKYRQTKRLQETWSIRHNQEKRIKRHHAALVAEDVAGVKAGLLAMVELYKGKHGQTEKQYQDSRSDAGKMISGDSKGSGANYSYRAKNTGPNPAGGSKKPQGQARMNNKDRAYLKLQKANLKKEEAVVEAKNGGDNDPCWDTHKKVGMKKKGGKMVPNCVPKNEEFVAEKKGSKPDYLDFDGDGDEKESMKKALTDKKKGGKCSKCGKTPCECDKKVEEGYKELPKNKMFRKAGNLGREAISTPIDPEKRQKAYDRSKKIVKTLNKANEEVSFSETELKKFEEIVNSWID